MMSGFVSCMSSGITKSQIKGLAALVAALVVLCLYVYLDGCSRPEASRPEAVEVFVHEPVDSVMSVTGNKSKKDKKIKNRGKSNGKKIVPRSPLDEPPLR